MRPMKIEENGAGFEVDEILNDLAQGHESVHSNHNLNMIDLNGVEIDEIIKHTRRGVRWNDDNNDVVNITSTSVDRSLKTSKRCCDKNC